MRSVKIIGITVILLSLNCVMAENPVTLNDAIGDGIVYPKNVSKPSIDIEWVKFYRYTNSTRVVVTLKVYGSKLEKNTLYWIVLVTTDGKVNRTYRISYANDIDPQLWKYLKEIIENQMNGINISLSGDLPPQSIVLSRDAEKNSTFIDGDFKIIDNNLLRVSFDLENKYENLSSIYAVTCFMNPPKDDSIILDEFLGVDLAYKSLNQTNGEYQDQTQQPVKNETNKQNGKLETKIPFVMIVIFVAIIAILIVAIIIVKKLL